MLEKTAGKFPPSIAGLRSAELAVIWYRMREIFNGAPYPTGSPEHIELSGLRRKSGALLSLVPKRHWHRTTRLTEEQISRMSHREDDGPSLSLNRRFNTGAKNPYIVGPKGKLPGPRPGEE